MAQDEKETLEETMTDESVETEAQEQQSGKTSIYAPMQILKIQKSVWKKIRTMLFRMQMRVLQKICLQ